MRFSSPNILSNNKQYDMCSIPHNVKELENK